MLTALLGELSGNLLSAPTIAVLPAIAPLLFTYLRFGFDFTVAAFTVATFCSTVFSTVS